MSNSLFVLLTSQRIGSWKKVALFQVIKQNYWNYGHAPNNKSKVSILPAMETTYTVHVSNQKTFWLGNKT